MLDAFRARLAMRAAHQAARERRPVRPESRVAERRLFAVLPAVGTEGAHGQAEAWRFLRALDVPASHIVPVVFGESAGVPDAFAGGVLHVTDANLDWRGVPRRVVAEGLWTQRPDVALDLSATPRSAALHLVGGAPAAVRIGLDPDPALAPFFDLVVTGGPQALARALARLDPPVLPVRSA